MLFQGGQVADGFADSLAAQTVKRPEQEDIIFMLVSQQQNPAESRPFLRVLSPRRNVLDDSDNIPLSASGVVPQLPQLVFGLLVFGGHARIDQNLPSGRGGVQLRGIHFGIHFVRELRCFGAVKYVNLGLVLLNSRVSGASPSV